MGEVKEAFVYRLDRREAKKLHSALKKIIAGQRITEAEDKQIDDLIEAIEWDLTPCVER